MGVSGTGKTTVGKALASKMEIPFYDADDFHPQGNIVKMKQGIPLEDPHRKSWLETLSKNLVNGKRPQAPYWPARHLKKCIKQPSIRHNK
ncbi:MAG: hypothetical protein CM1200mP10_12090 [Candidatus Neomarinimicrobiota bacterium]|nr:MAG: hypothetical protein CM1200mP10_12090 [Candidatus Neomarinimicrobiota bacterium]